jgi:thymidylate synthase ThyX
MEIHILDGADIPNPEDRAMVQALYSRDPRSVTEHLEKVRRVGSGKFMAQFYIGYGHKSIGDCGDVTICVEDCSILAAKAIQDSPLYRGQEASTRYLDMAARPLVSPTPAIRERQELWMDLYRRAAVELPALIRAEYPQRATYDDKVYEKAVRARAFDVARSLLPAGVTTFVSWTTDLRQARDHLDFLAHHPLKEVRDIAELLREALVVTYPSSFIDRTPKTSEEEDYLERSASACAYSRFDDFLPKVDPADYFVADFLLNTELLSAHRGLLRDRPRKCELHQRLRLCGHVDVESAIDYGSWRDLQRHRSMVAEVPLLTARHGFHQWYLDRLPLPICVAAAGLIGASPADLDPVSNQYALPLGAVVPVVARFPLPSAFYVAELRTGQSVHPTLRVFAQKLAGAICGALPQAALHADMSPDEWSLRRGKQDIVEVKP